MGSQMPRQPEPELMDLPDEAAAYARSDFSEVNRAFVERLLELAGLLDQAAVADLGTGPADIPIRVVTARPRWHVAAIDGAPAMLDIARQAVVHAGLDASIRLLEADAKRTGLPAASFDVVISNSLLHHVGETTLLWGEIRRIARPGALLLLRDLARPLTAEAARRIVELHASGESELLQEEFYRSLLSAYTLDEVRAQLEAAELSSLVVEMVSDRHLDVHGRLPL